MKEEASFIWSVYLLIMIDSLFLRPVPLHYTSLYLSTPLLIWNAPNYTSIHFTTLSFGLTHLNFLPLHFTSLQFIALLDDFRHPSVPFASPVYICLSNSVSKNFRFTRVSPYVYWTVHHLDSWIKRGQLDVTCFIISLFNAQHVSDVNTSILRSLH